MVTLCATRGVRSCPTSRFICLTVLLLVSCVAAHEMHAVDGIADSDLFRRLAAMGEIHIDRRSQPVVRDPWLAYRDTSPSSTTANPSGTRIVSVTSGSGSIVVATVTPSPTSGAHNTSAPLTTSVGTTSGLSIANATLGAPTGTKTSSTSTFSTPTSLPTPFDTSLGNNFTTTSCPSFFASFINNATFDACAPVSLLLQNSMAFFRAARSPSYMDKVLDNSCQSSLAICSPLMTSIANQLIDDSNCGEDYKRQNPIVMQAYSGLIAYEPIYNATCLQNPVTGNYCFTDAITNSSNPSDLYPYYTALGLPLPSTARPTCDACLQHTMAIFAGYAQEKGQPLTKTYIGCATQVDSVCGSTFADANVQVATVNKNAASRSGADVLSYLTVLFVSTCLVLM